MSPLRISALFGALGVGLGAFGAHQLRPLLELHQTMPVWQTASQYHLLHAVVLIWVSSQSQPSSLLPFKLFASGIFIFSGSLYALALTQIRWLGAITPLGGGLLILGWLSIFLLNRPSASNLKKPTSPDSTKHP